MKGAGATRDATRSDVVLDLLRNVSKRVCRRDGAKRERCELQSPHVTP